MARLFNGLKYLYSVISVIEKRLAGNTEKWTLVSSWTARVRLVHSQFLGGRRVPGLCQITWWIVYWQKIRGHIWKKLYGNREIFVARTVGVWEHTDSWLGAQIGSVLKPIQTLKEYFWSYSYCAQLGTPWHQIVGASRTVSNRESWYPRPLRQKWIVCQKVVETSCWGKKLVCRICLLRVFSSRVRKKFEFVWGPIMRIAFLPVKSRFGQNTICWFRSISGRPPYQALIRLNLTSQMYISKSWIRVTQRIC